MEEREHEQASGTPTWADLAVADAEATSTFFTTVLGWQVDAGQAEFGGYRMGMRDGMAVTGIMSAVDGEGHPLKLEHDLLNLYLATDDVDATCAKVTELGGTVVREGADVGELGRMAYCTDPQGVRFGLWQAGSLGGFSAVDGEGLPTWFELRTPDPKVAAEFYGALFGITFHEQQVSGAPYLLDDRFGITHGDDGHWLLYYQVADAAAATQQAQSAGAEVVVDPVEFEYGTYSDLRTPGGAPFGLLQPAKG